MGVLKEEKEKYFHCWRTRKYKQSPWVQFMSKRIASLNPCGRILDIGCGNGYATTALYLMGYDVYGLDITDAGWKTKSEVNNPFVIPENRLFTGSVWKIPFPDHFFEVTFSLTLLEHLPPEMVEKSISEILRVTYGKTVHYIDVEGKQVQFGHDLHLTIKPIDWWKEKFMANKPELEIIIKNKRNPDWHVDI